ncbi:MAG: thioesterase [Marinilabiliales bacterium]|nr:MAG: thioesterase [Marinilabiliales bacterium]
MEIKCKPGHSLELSMQVEEKDTAAAYGSGMVKVFASPAMIAFMENTALKAVLDFLPQGYNTVGTAVNVSHIKATPVGMKVTCKAEIVKIEGRKLVYAVKAWDEEGLIGEGEHTRFIIDLERFMSKLK